MRLNKYIAQATGLSRRAADTAIQDGRVTVNGQPPTIGQDISNTDKVLLDNSILTTHNSRLTIMLNKPPGYVCSRDGQGSQTIYDLLPAEYHQLKPVGRLDKNSSGLLLLTNDGQLAFELTHPKFQKTKIYKVSSTPTLSDADLAKLQQGVKLSDGVSKLDIRRLTLDDGKQSNVHRPPSNLYRVAMTEGRNRQIRRTFEALGYNVVKLHRTHFGAYELGNLRPGMFITI